MSTEKLRATLIIAGAGSGKTTDMVDEIMSTLPNLHSHRMLATITYTNSATETIRKRLAQKTGIPRNVFIGTIHSFLNHFVVIPYATIFEQAGLDKLFLEIDINQIVEKRVPITIKKNTPQYFGTKAKIKTQVMNKLLKDGKIPLDQISPLALTLIKIKEVQEAICNRLQFLFIDEFQDVDTVQFEIFDLIRKGNKTKIFAVGDPEQYIMGYTYYGRKKPTFKSLPINRFNADRKPKTENYRAFDEIVTFTNQFHFYIQQDSIKGGHPQAQVLFIAKSNLREIVGEYQKLCKQINYGDVSPLHFYLSFENKTFEAVAKDSKLVPLQVQHFNYKTPLEEALDLICSLVGLTKKQISEKYGLEPLEIRKMGIGVISAIDKGLISDRNTLVNYIADELKLEVTTIYDYNGKDLLRSLLLVVKNNENSVTNHQYSSIHKAKGLEADTVLTVARNRGELCKWLLVDKTARANDVSDTCRIGYVAFTRAKTLLCISCLESLDKEIEATLQQLGIKITNLETQPEQMKLFKADN